MIITIAAAVACVSTLLPAVAEIQQRVDERNNPTRLLKVPTRRVQVQGPRKTQN